MDKTFSLTDVEQQWFPIEVIERYFRLARKLDIPQQLHRLSARGWVMLKALRVGAKRFTLSCTRNLTVHVKQNTAIHDGLNQFRLKNRRSLS